jgi:hypothetical protein
VRQQSKKSFLRSVLTADDLRLKIEEQEKLIWTACFSFQNAALVSQGKKLSDLFVLLEKHRKENAASESEQKAYMQDIADKLEKMRSATSNTVFLDALLDAVNADPVRTSLTPKTCCVDRWSYILRSNK